MKSIRWLDENLEACIASSLLALIVLLISVQVFMRYVLGDGLSWTEESILWIFVWFIWVGISYAFKEERHVKVTFLVNFLPQVSKRCVEIFIDILIITFLIILTYQSYKLITLPWVIVQKSVVLNLPIYLLYASAPFGSILSIFRISQNLYNNYRSSSDVSAPQSID